MPHWSKQHHGTEYFYSYRRLNPACVLLNLYCTHSIGLTTHWGLREKVDICRRYFRLKDFFLLRNIWISTNMSLKWMAGDLGDHIPNYFMYEHGTEKATGHCPNQRWPITLVPTCVTRVASHSMMTSSNGNIFRVTGLLSGEFSGPGEFPVQRPVTRSFDVFFDLRLNKRLSKQPWGWWFETPSLSLWRQYNDKYGLSTYGVSIIKIKLSRHRLIVTTRIPVL